MTDIDTILAAIRETSAKAEHGPWRAQPCEPASRYSDIKGDLDLGWGAHIARGVKNENAAHIAACCPANMGAVIAHIDTLTRERDDAWAFAALRDQRDADMQSLMATNNELLAGRDAAAEAMRARCEALARDHALVVWHHVCGPNTIGAQSANDIAVAIAARKVESAPAPRDAEIAALREAPDDAEPWIERHQEEAHDGAEWASLLTKIDCAMRASAALTAPCSTCGPHEKIDAALAKGSPR